MRRESQVLKRLNGVWTRETRVTIRRLGPVNSASITIRPITILIGKNCYGKSLLLNLLYLLSDTTPDFVKLSEAMAEKDLFQLAEKAYDALEGGDRQAVSSLLTEMLHRIFECLDAAFAKTFKEKFKDFFEVESISSLFYGGYLEVERGSFSYSLNTSGDDVFLTLSTTKVGRFSVLQG